jgi:VWFA-related protein
MRFRVTLLALAWATLTVAAQSTDQERPRFRSGANLVRIDAYVSQDGVPIEDLRLEDLEVYEDDKRQTLEAIDLVKARGPNPPSERTDAASIRTMRQGAVDSARLFTLFLDRFHVSVAGGYHANKPIIATLDRIIGPDDMVGVMTPEMSPSAITYSSRTSSIERYVTDTWAWGLKDQVTITTPQEQTIKACYADTRKYGNVADAMIARLREQRTLDALAGLVTHLEGLRPERKFVMVFTEGWRLYTRDDSLARVLDDKVPGQDPLRVDPIGGRIAGPGTPDTARGLDTTFETCERLRVMLAAVDHELDFRALLQRANRANVSFYPIDARGLIVFDQPTRADLDPSLDREWLRQRHEDLHTMALQTDGVAVLDNTNDITGAMRRIFADVGSYYLLSYYSSNTRLDGRFRRVRVEVKRKDVDVRARPGYLAPTEEEARAAGATVERPAANRAAPPPTVTRALDAITPGRGHLPVRIQASGARSSIRAVVELDSATIKQPEWMSGGTLRLTIDPDRGTAGTAQTITTSIDPGQRSISITGTDRPLTPGRYALRAELTPRAGRLPVQVTTFATVPAEAAEVGTGALALRRGPGTGLSYVPTADPRFRRTERVRMEVPLMSDGHTGTARLLTQQGQPMPLVATYSTRVDEARALTLAVAEVNLAPLAAGEYVLELTLAKDGKSEVITYGIRIVP